MYVRRERFYRKWRMYQQKSCCCVDMDGKILSTLKGVSEKSAVLVYIWAAIFYTKCRMSQAKSGSLYTYRRRDSTEDEGRLSIVCTSCVKLGGYILNQIDGVSAKLYFVRLGREVLWEMKDVSLEIIHVVYICTERFYRK